MLETLEFPQSKVHEQYIPHSQAPYIYSCVYKAQTIYSPRGWTRQTQQKSTTSILTAATLIYTSGAGITAAAGTRLALQLVLTMHVKFGSFQLQDMYALYCYLLSLPPCVSIG